jgi:hypothetical protein
VGQAAADLQDCRFRPQGKLLSVAVEQAAADLQDCRFRVGNCV